MGDSEAAAGPPAPRQVVYHPVSGVPEEFHDYLNKESEAYKRLKLSRATSTSEKENTDVVEEKEKPGKKKKPKLKEIIITTSTRQKKKAITAVEGLDLFGIKLSDAAKVCGKKYACGASVVVNPSQKEQIDIQGDVQDVLPKLLLEKYGASHGLEAKHIVLIVGKQRVNYEDY